MHVLASSCICFVSVNYMFVWHWYVRCTLTFIALIYICCPHSAVFPITFITNANKNYRRTRIYFTVCATFVVYELHCLRSPLKWFYLHHCTLHVNVHMEELRSLSLSELNQTVLLQLYKCISFAQILIFVLSGIVFLWLTFNVKICSNHFEKNT